jgi:hypothetical protein
MKEALKHIATLVLLAVSSAVLGYVLGCSRAKRDATPPEVHTDTIVRVDTIRIEHPTDTVTVTKWKRYYVHDTAVVTQHDSVFVILQYEQHCLTLPDTLDLWYSGVDARVDSLRVYLRTTSITQTITTAPAPRRNTIGVSAGLGDASVMYIRDVGRVALGFAAGYTIDREPTARGFLGWKF